MPAEIEILDSGSDGDMASDTDTDTDAVAAAAVAELEGRDSDWDSDGESATEPEPDWDALAEPLHSDLLTDRVREELGNALVCCVCSHVAAPAMQCCNGHTTCNPCAARITELACRARGGTLTTEGGCPMCRLPIAQFRQASGRIECKMWRNRAVEHLADALDVRVRCRNGCYGCPSPGMAVSALHDHERACLYYPVRCPAEGCSFVGSAYDLRRHMAPNFGGAAGAGATRHVEMCARGGLTTVVEVEQGEWTGLVLHAPVARADGGATCIDGDAEAVNRRGRFVLVDTVRRTETGAHEGTDAAFYLRITPSQTVDTSNEEEDDRQVMETGYVIQVGALRPRRPWRSDQAPEALTFCHVAAGTERSDKHLRAFQTAGHRGCQWPGDRGPAGEFVSKADIVAHGGIGLLPGKAPLDWSPTQTAALVLRVKVTTLADLDFVAPRWDALPQPPCCFWDAYAKTPPTARSPLEWMARVTEPSRADHAADERSPLVLRSVIFGRLGWVSQMTVLAIGDSLRCGRPLDATHFSDPVRKHSGASPAVGLAAAVAAAMPVVDAEGDDVRHPDVQLRGHKACASWFTDAMRSAHTGETGHGFVALGARANRDRRAAATRRAEAAVAAAAAAAEPEAAQPRAKRPRLRSYRVA
jgi:hypothetical protein